MPYDECEWCGSTDRLLRTDFETSTVHDARMAQIPRMSLCVNCADDLTEYMEFRVGEQDNDIESEFTTAEAESIATLLRENPGLELVTRSRFRIRYQDGEWHEFGYVIGEPRRRAFSEEEMIGRIRSVREFDLRCLDEAAWEVPDRL